MRNLAKAVFAGAIVLQLTTCGVFGQIYYQLDNGIVGGAFNASDGVENLDNWMGNEFVAQAGGTLITRVDFGCFTNTPGQQAQVVIYRLGNPTIGPTRIYTQTFTPLFNTDGSVRLNQITLTTPVQLNVGDPFVVSIFERNVDGANSFPWTVDTGTSSVNSFWGRSTPNTFNLDDLSGTRRLDLALAPGGYVPGPGHLIIRALGSVVPEPSVFALAGLGIFALISARRNKA